VLDAWADGLQASDLSRTLRASLWLYPMVNAGHVIGVALLFGAIVPLDLRLLGLWRTLPVAPLARVLVPTAVAGLLLATANGALLFAARPLDYLREPLFGLKLLLVTFAVANALALRRLPWGHGWRETAGSQRAPAGARWAAALSIALWLAIIVIGRLLGYR
jgi:hypothetical protein